MNGPMMEFLVDGKPELRTYTVRMVRQRIQEKITLKPHWYRYNGSL